MDRDEYLGRATRIFLKARDLDAAARKSFLNEACASDNKLRRDMESLLMNDDTTVTRSSKEDPPPLIPGYRVIQKLGDGGMGEVWLARQDQPVQRDVAIKVIKAGMDTKHVIARFAVERQALALMDHPSIAKIFDAGETPRGLPFFVMEYVKGEAITAYADRHLLAIQERLHLFLQVCDAIQHAHQKGVIHRDLKPSNVLVSVHGQRAVPKIIDFGVAKATARRLTEQSLFTEIGTLIGTPEYMSPEQAEMTGLDVDTRSDVYSLGVILYELLVGTLPLDSRELRAAGFDEIRRRIREVEPATPSSRLRTLGAASTEMAQHRRSEPMALRRQLRGDLDWITMRALEKDRTRRYQSPSELAAEIARHQVDEPVLAGPPSVRYRLGKFVRRHRTGVAAATLIVIAILGGFTASMVGFVRAQRAERRAIEEAETASQVTDFLRGIFESSDPFKFDKQTVTLREVLDRGAERVQHELKASPRVQARLLRTVGGVYASLGLGDQAVPLLEESLRIAERTEGPDHPETAITLRELSQVCADHARRVQLAARALDIDERVLGPDHLETARALNRLASAYWGAGESEKEDEPHNRAMSIFEKRLAPDSVDLADHLRYHAFFLRRRGRFTEAEQAALRALAIQEQTFGVNHPQTAWTLNSLGNIYDSMREYAKAEAAHAKCAAIFAKMFDEPPRNLAYLALAKYRLGKLDEAAAMLETIIKYHERRGVRPEDPNLDGAHWYLVLLYQAQGRHAEARELYKRVFHKLESDDPTKGPSPFHEGRYWAIVKDRSRTLACLRRAVSDGYGRGEQLGDFRDSEFAFLQSDNEFEAIVAEATARSRLKAASSVGD